MFSRITIAMALACFASARVGINGMSTQTVSTIPQATQAFGPDSATGKATLLNIESTGGDADANKPITLMENSTEDPQKWVPVKTLSPEEIHGSNNKTLVLGPNHENKKYALQYTNRNGALVYSAPVVLSPSGNGVVEQNYMRPKGTDPNTNGVVAGKTGTTTNVDDAKKKAQANKDKAKKSKEDKKKDSKKKNSFGAVSMFVTAATVVLGCLSM
ncbi:hypothetical protein ENBRE01_0864 [Enteropsectra breve]|nr:hypothetical protein ENBRE01_0864 [Enteropsectra breve]